MCGITFTAKDAQAREDTVKNVLVTKSTRLTRWV